MEKETLSIEIREAKGKGPARSLRRAGKLPGVLYGHGSNICVSVDPMVIYGILQHEGGMNKILSLSGLGLENKRAMIKDYQVDPVSRKLLHVDLLEILATQKIEVLVALNFVGKPIGVTETGGVMSVVERKIAVSCLPDSIPQSIDVEVSHLKIGDSVHLSEITLPPGVEKVSITNPTLVTVVPPIKEEDLAPSLGETAEPEVITEKKAAEEGEEGEGEEAEAKDGEKGEKKAAAPGKAAPVEEKKDKKEKKDKEKK